MTTVIVTDTTGAEHRAEVNPTDLSDRARAAVAQFKFGYPVAITLVSHALVVRHWRIWPAWAGGLQTVAEYIEAEVAGIPSDWWVDELVSGGEAARMVGVTASTWRGYAAAGRTPPPDDPGDCTMPATARRPRWFRSTVARWMAGRPGQGARTDLLTHP